MSESEPSAIRRYLEAEAAAAGEQVRFAGPPDAPPPPEGTTRVEIREPDLPCALVFHLASNQRISAWIDGEIRDALRRLAAGTQDALVLNLPPGATVDVLHLEDPHLVDARRLVNAQADDEGLWFAARTAPEQYLQDALRTLHRKIEGRE